MLEYCESVLSGGGGNLAYSLALAEEIDEVIELARDSGGTGSGFALSLARRGDGDVSSLSVDVSAAMGTLLKLV